jgi:hypothetical protein
MGQNPCAVQALECGIARNVVLMGVGIDNEVHPLIFHLTQKLFYRVGATGVHHDSVNPVAGGEIKALSPDRAGKLKLRHQAVVFNAYHILRNPFRLISPPGQWYRQSRETGMPDEERYGIYTCFFNKNQ